MRHCCLLWSIHWSWNNNSCPQRVKL